MTWYLSFATADGWLGGVIVHAPDFIAAVRVAHVLRINPGGQVRGMEFDMHVPDEFRNRLLSKDDLAALDRAQGGSGEFCKW